MKNVHIIVISLAIGASCTISADSTQRLDAKKFEQMLSPKCSSFISDVLTSYLKACNKDAMVTESSKSPKQKPKTTTRLQDAADRTSFRSKDDELDSEEENEEDEEDEDNAFFNQKDSNTEIQQKTVAQQAERLRQSRPQYRSINKPTQKK